MRIQRAGVRFGFVCILVFASGCANGLLGGGRGARDDDSTETPMTPDRMELVFADQVEAIEGPRGALRTQVDGINVYLISDPTNDRMRIMAPIARVDRLAPQIMPLLLQANFHSALDARYALSEGAIYAVYLHPISSLREAEIVSALDQVVSLVKTFGTTFSSGVLRFAPGEATDR